VTPALTALAFSATRLRAGNGPPAHLEGLFQASAWYDGATSTATAKEI
jgi:hypothetical protein